MGREQEVQAHTWRMLPVGLSAVRSGYTLVSAREGGGGVYGAGPLVVGRWPERPGAGAGRGGAWAGTGRVGSGDWWMKFSRWMGVPTASL